MIFQSELEFEEALINILKTKGWENNVLKYPTEEDLIKNWADIIFANNRDIDRLDQYPLTKGEMQQILEQIKMLRTPLKLNGFINGKTVSITRDNPDDKLHFGKEISLKIYDKKEIAAGQSRYQIAEQPQFKNKFANLNKRRGDLMLLINGMPVVHIELKRSNIPVSEACAQIQKYAFEGVFTGIFSLTQIFVAMQPEETVYFANPGPDGKFDKNFYFHWEDFNNNIINNWKDIATSLLSIVMVHQLIGLYTVADDSDGKLKVMRSYQYYAANAISDKVTKMNWEDKNVLGGYIAHATGSGKTMTSFKSAQLIAGSKDADKVIFLMDRIELGTQSLKEYRGFADENESVQATEDTEELITKLKSTDPADTLIVTSIQKMSRIKDEEDGLNSNDIKIMNSKRIVFIVDECHRSTFGNMLIAIKKTFPRAIFFGFTGTPILKENQKKLNTTATVFGDELHRYTIADAIRDKNVLGFDTYKVLTFKDLQVRKQIALNQAKASSEEEIYADEKKTEIYNKFMYELKMYGYRDKNNNYIKGIEDYIPNSQYETKEHQQAVVEDILENWNTLSWNREFSAILATSSIREAIEYYHLFKQDLRANNLNIVCLFDQTIDNNDNFKVKEEALIELIDDYNRIYDQTFTMRNFSKMKKDIASRLAHKKPYTMISKSEQIDLIIVVDQMLTGFDSKWINTLYLDKVLKYENIIQAFSRTNRIYGDHKSFGTIKYYRKPHTMEQNIKDAVKLYSGDRPIELFVQKLDKNVKTMNRIFEEIKELFNSAGIYNFEKNPTDKSERGKFAALYNQFYRYLEAARIQGFQWNKPICKKDEKGKIKIIKVKLDSNTFQALTLRYKELFTKRQNIGTEESGETHTGTAGKGRKGVYEPPYNLEGYITEIDAGKIDENYINTRFQKYIKALKQEKISPEALNNTLNELYKSFASLTQDEQKYANIFLHDIQSGSIKLQPDKTFRDYVTEYQSKGKKNQIKQLATLLGVDYTKLLTLTNLKLTEKNINEYGRFDELIKTADLKKAKAYFESKQQTKQQKPLSDFEVNLKLDELLRNFIINGANEL